VTYQALPLQVRQHRERRLERPLNRMMRVEHAAKVHHIEHVKPEIAQIVAHGLRQLFAGEGRQPRAILAALGADLGDDDEIVRILRE
jgi:hypothetical protein